jgi:hypothetical protein
MEQLRSGWKDLSEDAMELNLLTLGDRVGQVSAVADDSEPGLKGN